MTKIHIFDNTEAHLAQLYRIFSYYQENTASRFMCSVDTGIPIQNVCRLVGMLSDKIRVAKKAKCQISSEIVEFLTTNPDLFPVDNQLKLWPDYEKI